MDIMIHPREGIFTPEEIAELERELDLAEGTIAWSGAPPPEAIKAQWLGFKWVEK